MHELPVTQNIIDIAVRYAQEAHARRVTDLYLVIGQLSSVVDDSVQFYWDLLAEGTVCEGAQLHFRRLPAVFHCKDCSLDYPIERELHTCPKCRGSHVVLVQGDEFTLESMDIERAQEGAASSTKGET